MNIFSVVVICWHCIVTLLFTFHPLLVCVKVKKLRHFHILLLNCLPRTKIWTKIIPDAPSRVSGWGGWARDRETNAVNFTCAIYMRARRLHARAYAAISGRPSGIIRGRRARTGQSEFVLGVVEQLWALRVDVAKP